MLQEILLIAFIILSPIYKCLAAITFVDLNIISLIVGVMLACYVLNVVHLVNSRQKTFYSFTILLVFCMELLLFSHDNNVGWVLLVLLYVVFLQTDEEVSLSKLYRAILISSIIAAAFSLNAGLIGGRIIRTAALVDGSIAPIAITVILFWNIESSNQRAQNYGLLEVLSIISSMIVIAFGMSRSRIIIVALVFYAYIMSKLFSDGAKSSGKRALILAATMALGLVLLISGTLQSLFEPIVERFFDEGLNSMGREAENKFALELFKDNPFFGGGWGGYRLQDMNGSIVPYDNHSAYLAILARGGLLFAIPVFLSYFSLLKRSWLIRKSSQLSLALILVFLMLSYANAGMFNYTICGIIPVVVLDIKRRERYED